MCLPYRSRETQVSAVRTPDVSHTNSSPKTAIGAGNRRRRACYWPSDAAIFMRYNFSRSIGTAKSLEFCADRDTITPRIKRVDICKITGRCIGRSEQHTSELQSLMRISYAVFCLKHKNKKTNSTNNTNTISTEHTIILT